MPKFLWLMKQILPSSKKFIVSLNFALSSANKNLQHFSFAEPENFVAFYLVNVDLENHIEGTCIQMKWHYSTQNANLLKSSHSNNIRFLNCIEFLLSFANKTQKFTSLWKAKKISWQNFQNSFRILENNLLNLLKELSNECKILSPLLKVNMIMWMHNP